MTLNYRVVKKDGEVVIYSVYYSEDGKILGCRETPAIVVGEDLEELKTQLKLMTDALNKDVIDFN